MRVFRLLDEDPVGASQGAVRAALVGTEGRLEAMADYARSNDGRHLGNFHVDAGRAGALGPAVLKIYLQEIVCGLCRHFGASRAMLTTGHRLGGAKPDGRIIGAGTPFIIECEPPAL